MYYLRNRCPYFNRKYKNTNANINYEKPTVSTQLGNFAKDISEYTAKLRESLEGNNFEEFKKDLKISREALKDIRLAVEKELSVNQMKLEDLDVSEAKKRHNSFVQYSKPIECF